MKALLAAVAILGVAIVGSPKANATTITFGTYNRPEGFETIGPSYTESGYLFTDDITFFRWQNGSASDSDPTSSTALGNFYAQTLTTLSRTDGGAFDLFSIDADDVYNSGIIGSVNYEYEYSGGGTGSGSFMTDDVPGFSTILLNLANLSYFSFRPSSEINWIQFDNVKLSSSVVPIPATLPLLASALGVLGWAARRRSKVTRPSLHGTA